MRFVRLTEVEDTERQWLWPAWIPIGDISVLFGDPGIAKTNLLLALVAIIVSGGEFPDGTRCSPGRVLYLDGENGEDEIKRKMKAMGLTEAEFGNIKVASVLQADGSMQDFDFMHDDDLEVLSAELDAFRPTLVIVDPLTAFHKGKEISTTETRALSNTQARLARKYNCAWIYVKHPNKDEMKIDLYRVSGSLEFVAAARIVHMVEWKDEEVGTRVLKVVKSNLAAFPDSIVFRLDDDGVVQWTGETILRETEPKGARDKARAFLKNVLAEGRLAQKELQRKAKEAGHSWSTLRRACKNIDIKPYKDSNGPWYYELP